SEKQWLLVQRNGVLIACNFGLGYLSLPLKTPPGALLLSSKEGVVVDPSSLILPGECVAVFGSETSRQEFESFKRRTARTTGLTAGLLFDERFIALIRDLEPDPSALGRKLAGVLKEIDESLPQALGIGVDPDDSRRLNEVDVLSARENLGTTRLQRSRRDFT